MTGSSSLYVKRFIKDFPGAGCKGGGARLWAASTYIINCFGDESLTLDHTKRRGEKEHPCTSAN